MKETKRLNTHQSLSNAVKQESIAMSEGSMGSASIITLFTTWLLRFKAENQQTFIKRPPGELHGFEGGIKRSESEKKKAEINFIEITLL